MRDFIVDQLLPATDRAVAIQWIVMGIFWTALLLLTRRVAPDVRTFLMGLAMLNLAWFAARTVH